MNTILKFLILFIATGLLPWVAFFIGQVSTRIAFYAHAFGVLVVCAMKLYEHFAGRKGERGTRQDPG